eukprot:ANDGO_04921.mRNA.1 Inosine-uridine-preferring nucleoside hydrolase homolog
MQRTRVWLDCDPGHDDAMAIILCLFSPGLRLCGISTVAGNQSIEKVTANAFNMLAVANRTDIPVLQGCSDPLRRPPMICPEIHGESGLDGYDFLSHNLCPTFIHSQRTRKHSSDATNPIPAHPSNANVSGNANAAGNVNVESEQENRMGAAEEGGLCIEDALYNEFCQMNEPCVLIATGAQTNVARLLKKYGAEIPNLEKIVFMGGSTDGKGNTSPYAEFNIQVDPEACDTVVGFRRREQNACERVVMVPLQVTHTALVTRSILNRIESLGTPFAKLIVSLLLFFADTYRTVFHFEDPPLHDPCAVFYVLNPAAFQTRRSNIIVDCSESNWAGHMALDWSPLGNVVVCESMDVEMFWDAMIDAIVQANQVSLLNSAASTSSN